MAQRLQVASFRDGDHLPLGFLIGLGASEGDVDALRAAMPDVTVAVHVKLPERRSCDLLVGDKAWVEVLGLSLAAMEKPASHYQRDCVEHWRMSGLGQLPFST